MAKILYRTSDKQYIQSTYNFLHIGFIGVIVGAVVWVLSWLIGTFIIDPLLCREAILQACSQSNVVAGNIAAVVGAALGIMLLIRLHVRRSLWIAFAVIVSLWGMTTLTSNIFWVEAIAWTLAAYSLSYVLFTWLLRFRSIFISIIITVFMVLVLRWIAFL